MRRIRLLLCVLLALCTLLPCLPAALAEEAAGEDERFAGKTWDQVVADFLAAWGVDPDSVAMGYYNTVTGEEHYLNPDQYMVTGSMYKVPLNMIFVDRITAGEMDWDTLISSGRLDVLMTGSLEESNNSYSYTLTRYFGSYRKFRIRTSYLYGMTPEETMADRRYLRDSWITPRRMITCLQTLYNEPDRFPRVTMHLFRAQPGRYFRWFEDRWPIAQKYGYYRISWLEISTAGIVYVPERPFLLVVLTHGAPMAEENIGRLCTLMGDYALTLIEQKPSLSR